MPNRVRRGCTRRQSVHRLFDTRSRLRSLQPAWVIAATPVLAAFWYGIALRTGQAQQPTAWHIGLGMAVALGIAVLLLRLQRKNVELARGEARYRALFDDSKIPLLLHDPADGRIVVANEAAASFYGYRLAHLLHLRISDIDPMPQTPEPEPSPPHCAHRLAGGEIRQVVVHSGPIEADGRLLVYSFVHDITERRRAQSALQESDAFKQDILDSMVAQIAVLDPGCVILAVNETWRRFALENSATPDQPAPHTGVGVNYLDACKSGTDEERQEIQKTVDGIRAVLNGSQPAYSCQYPCHSPSRPRWFKMMVMPLGKERAGCAVVAHIDITKRIEGVKQIDSLLRQQKAILDNELVGIVTVKKRHIVWANPAFEAMLAYAPGQMAGLPTRVLYLSEATYRAFGADSYAAIATGDVFRTQFEFVRKDAQHVWLNVSGSALNTETGETLWGFVDVSALVRSEAQLKQSEERFRTIADYTYDWEYWEADSGQILYVSPACERVSGYSQADFYADKDLLSRIIHPDDAECYAAHQQQCGLHDEASVSFRIIHKSGRVLWIAHGCRTVPSGNGHSMGRRANNRDVTELKAAEDLASQLAYTDSLTDLPNRRMLQIRLDQCLSQAQRFHRSLAVMFLDLDRFKEINDRYGHEIGDGLLIEVARRLCTSIRTGDTVARPGGDEFIILLPEISCVAQAERVAKKILHTLESPMLIHQQALSITASVGIAVLPVDALTDGRTLLKMADTAMYVIKGSGRNGYHLYRAGDEARRCASPQIG